MVPENAQETIEPASVAPVHEPDNEIVVHRESITAIYIPCFFEEASSPETCFLGKPQRDRRRLVEQVAGAFSANCGNSRGLLRFPADFDPAQLRASG